MDDRSVKENFYHDFLLIKKMKASFQTKHRMLWEMLGMSGKNKDFWRVVGITELAFNKIVKNDVNVAKKSIKNNRIQRAHIKKRIETSPMFTSVYKIKAYRDILGNTPTCNVGEKLDDQTFTIPLHPGLTDNEINIVINEIKKNEK